MSKFAGVLKAAKSDETVTEAEARPVPLRTARGRTKGKRSDPAFEQVTAYIRKETYRQTKLALLNANDSRDFSQLIEELLGAYLRTRKSE